MPELRTRAAIEAKLFADDTTLVRALAQQVGSNDEERRRTHQIACALVSAIRAGRKRQGGIDAFMGGYALSSEEGVVPIDWRSAW